MLDTKLWPRNYFESRELFLDSARTSGAQLNSIASELLGPQGEPLSVDVAAFVSENDNHRIVLTSGLHGVEGFIGAAIQLQVMNLLAQEGLPDHVGLVCIHALNPWGFAHQRRVDENNVDVNRNFLDFKSCNLDQSEEYAALDPIINPPLAPSFSGDARYWLNAGRLIVKNRGVEKLAGPLASGQYHFPKGLFYGGARSSVTRSRIEDCVRKYVGTASQVTVLDVHSGLGPSGVATLIGNSNRVLSGHCVEWLHNHYEMPVVLDSSPDNAYDASGSWSQWCLQEFVNQQFTFLCVEIGTVNPIKLFNALRRENQAHHWAQPEGRAFTRAKTDLMNVFSPSSQRWRNDAIVQGVKAYRKTLLPLQTPIV